MKIVAWLALLIGTIVWSLYACFAAVMSFSFVGSEILTIPVFWLWVMSPPLLWAACIYTRRTAGL